MRIDPGLHTVSYGLCAKFSHELTLTEQEPFQYQ
jgi:hypothetical protein